jgi:hypothetical protein
MLLPEVDGVDRSARALYPVGGRGGFSSIDCALETAAGCRMIWVFLSSSLPPLEKKKRNRELRVIRHLGFVTILLYFSVIFSVVNEVLGGVYEEREERKRGQEVERVEG